MSMIKARADPPSGPMMFQPNPSGILYFSPDNPPERQPFDR